MNKELLAMQSVQSLYFSPEATYTSLAGADTDELKKRFDILRYGYEARTRSTLKEWTQHLFETMGEEKWNQLGYQFSISEAFKESQIGSLPLNYFKWLRTKISERSAIEAIDRDHAFFQSQNSYYDDKNLLQEPPQILEKRIQLQKSAQLIPSQNLIISRDREKFYIHQLNPKWIPALIHLTKSSDQIDNYIPDGCDQAMMIDFVVNAIQKKWFKIVD